MTLRAMMAAICLLVAPPVLAQTPCTDSGFHWSDGKPRLNLRHIFCGEINRRGDPVGLHSRALVTGHPLITGIEPQQTTPDGLYGATVRFQNGGSKFSSFFPDQCSPAQIEQSVRYAEANRIGAAKPWGYLGCSAPAEGGAGYCTGTGGERLVIRFGTTQDGDINTAFPLIGQDCPS